MPRPLRIEFKNAWYHVMNRGANRQAIFKSIANRNLFYTILSEIVDPFKIEIHAFCLMGNHYHLLIKTPYPNLSKAMRHLDGIYTQRFNRAVRRHGPLFRGRYKAILIDSDQYLLQVSRYIHLNPIAAKICAHPLEYKWSSYPSYVDKKSIVWLTTAYTLNQMPSDDKITAYASFVTEGTDEETRRFYEKKNTPSIYGTKKFIETHLNDIEPSYESYVLTDINHTRPLPGKDLILNCVADHFQISPVTLREASQGRKNTAKPLALYLLRQLGHVSHSDIALMFAGLKTASISPQINRFKKVIANDKTIQQAIDDITHAIRILAI